ncbi:MAG: transcriptional repressor, partial [Synechococcales cyanobacterium]
SKMTLKEGYQLLDCQLTIHAICPSCQRSLMTD